MSISSMGSNQTFDLSTNKGVSIIIGSLNYGLLINVDSGIVSIDANHSHLCYV